MGEELKKLFMLCESMSEKDAEVLGVSTTNGNRFLANCKWDGERLITFKMGNEVLLYNRRGSEVSYHFPEVCSELAKLPFNCWLDGEVISRDDDFTKLQSRALTRNPTKIKALIEKIPVTYMVFDILKFDTEDIRDEKLSDRIIKLNELFKDFSGDKNIVALTEYKPITEMLEKAKAEDREGIIVKDMNSYYASGRRVDSWRKCKRWLETDIVFTKYTTNPSGIRIETDDGVVSCQVQGFENSREVREILDKNGSVEVTIQHLETFTRDDGKLSYRFPSYKKVVYPENSHNSEKSICELDTHILGDTKNDTTD